MNIKVITTGEKLKEIRKKYKIKQYELSGNKLTRNMISMLETNKAKLTKDTAEILIENIHKICEEKSIECDVTLDYLLESPEYQTQKICKEFIEFLNCNSQKVFQIEFQKTLNEIQTLLDKYKLRKEKIIIYTKLGEIFNDYHNFYKAYTYYLRVFEMTNDLFNNLQLIDLIIEISYCCNNLKKYKETLNFNRLAYIYMNNIPELQEYKIKFNNVIAYKNLKDYDSALKEIDEIEHSFKDNLNLDTIRKINIMSLKANCLKEKKFYIDSLQVHKKILALSKNNIEMYLVTLCNMIEVYIEMNDSKNLKKYIDKCNLNLKQYKQLQDKKYSSEIYNDIGLGCYAVNKYEISKEYFNEALKEARKYKKIDIILSALEKLLSIAVNNKDTEEIDNLKNQLLEIMSVNLLPSNNLLIFKFIGYYNNLGDKEAINDLVTFTTSMFSK